MKIDSHHHFWIYSAEQYGWIGPDMGVLKRDFLVDELQAATSGTGVEGAISVQARQSVEETKWLVRLASESPFVRGVVGWVPLAEKNIQQVLDSLVDSQDLKAVRHVVQDEPDDAFLLRSDFNRGVELLQPRGLVYDILIYARQLPASIQFADKHPNQVFVLDHIAKPTIKQDDYDKTWEDNFRELAKRPNVYCKFSGVVTEVRDESWELSSIRPYWEVALEAFGTNRLMFGSDWPVCLLRSRYDQWVQTVEELANDFSETENAAFWGGNCARAYGLDGPPLMPE